MAHISPELLTEHLKEYLTLKKMTSVNDVIIPTFGRWMSTKYNWDNPELIAEEDFNKAFSLIAEQYVQKNP